MSSRDECESVLTIDLTVAVPFKFVLETVPPQTLQIPDGSAQAAATQAHGSAQPGTPLDVRPKATQTAPHPHLEHYNQARVWDDVRRIVAVGLLIVFGFVIVWATCYSASSKEKWEQAKEMLHIILPPLAGLIGSVLGFYFGSKGNHPGDRV